MLIIIVVLGLLGAWILGRWAGLVVGAKKQYLNDTFMLTAVVSQMSEEGQEEFNRAARKVKAAQGRPNV